jgi:sec-independent protein translocase protein TatB
MFGIDWQELLVIIVVAVVVIGPKDMPLALRTAGRWIARVRRVSNHFRSGIEAMIREAEMEEMEQKWAAQNDKIMREHPADAPPEMEPTGAYPSPPAPPVEAAAESPPAAEEPLLPFGKRK